MQIRCCGPQHPLNYQVGKVSDFCFQLSLLKTPFKHKTCMCVCVWQVRVVIALVYLVVCVLGLVGNLLALFLLHSRRRGYHHSSIDCFVMSLALTDLQFVLTLPFWAVDTLLDFRWPFGQVMCKIVSSVTTMNMYASVFFLTAMSVTRYRSLVTALKMESPRSATARAKWASSAIWVVSLVATLPHAFYSTTVQVCWISTQQLVCLQCTLCVLDKDPLISLFMFPGFCRWRALLGSLLWLRLWSLGPPSPAGTLSNTEGPSGFCGSPYYHLCVLPPPAEVYPEPAHCVQHGNRECHREIWVWERPPPPPIQSDPLRHYRSSLLFHLLAAQPGPHLVGGADQIWLGALQQSLLQHPGLCVPPDCVPGSC